MMLMKIYLKMCPRFLLTFQIGMKKTCRGFCNVRSSPLNPLFGGGHETQDLATSARANAKLRHLCHIRSWTFNLWNVFVLRFISQYLLVLIIQVAFGIFNIIILNNFNVSSILFDTNLYTVVAVSFQDLDNNVHLCYVQFCIILTTANASNNNIYSHI